MNHGVMILSPVDLYIIDNQCYLIYLVAVLPVLWWIIGIIVVNPKVTCAVF